MSGPSAAARWLVAAAAAWLTFTVITVITVATGGLNPIDHGMTAAVRGFREGVAIVVARPAATLGALAALTMAVALAAGGLLVQTRRALVTAVMLGSAAATAGTVYLLSVAIGRVGPSIDMVSGGSGHFAFPSGHTTNATVVYVLAALLVTRGLGRPLWRIVVVIGAVGLALLIGLSRIYLGYDWPTHVLAGWLLAGGVVCTAYGSLLLLDGHPSLSPPSDDDRVPTSAGAAH